ncbi:MAG: flagellar biosynthesis protein FliQ [Alphaproteobacteria bacterium]|jgi:flagellar biosynthetic protein FliQ|nr:flagellar biosynthesis protein FliQ [Alphaproteobacteria bacterium]MDP7223025.1 flagellar biosynthesis protein FliQ [Alphaproteobacteria bacterium]
MEQGEIIDLLRHALFLVLQIGAPPMLIGLCIGVIVALFQALTQIQEMTLVFVPKILAIFTAIAVMFPSMISIMQNFMQIIADRISSM